MMNLTIINFSLSRYTPPHAKPTPLKGLDEALSRMAQCSPQVKKTVQLSILQFLCTLQLQFDHVFFLHFRSSNRHVKLLTRPRSHWEILNTQLHPNHLIGHSRSMEVQQKLLQSHLERPSMFQSPDLPGSLRSKPQLNQSQRLLIH